MGQSESRGVTEERERRSVTEEIKITGGQWGHWGKHFLCGALIGAGAILPGISGGVLAVVFGIYRPFMEILTHPKTALREHWRLVMPLALGWGVGFLLIARGLSAAMAASETLCVWLFMGLIAGSVPTLFRDAGKQGRPVSAWLWLGLCAAGLLAGFYYVRHILHIEAEPNFWWYNFCGVLWGVGTVLPGFSASPVMMALGLYQPLLDDLSGMDWRSLAACLPGAVGAMAVLARMVSRLFRLHYAAASHGILGIVCASALSMTPREYHGAGEVCLSAVCFAAGFALAHLMERVDRNPPQNRPPA